jgi:tetratricopeptide (TPR) repeat protein
MNPEVQRLFAAAMELPEEQRAPYLASQTAEPDVRNEVFSLLLHDSLAEPFFEKVLGSAAASLELTLDLQPGVRVGPFTIQRTLGHGGMGAVYLGTRSDGVFDQQVAIKVIRPSPSLSFLPERFRQERQILAKLSHPHIARLLDGGETAEGLPYFVLEYVAGEQIDRYCDKRSLSLNARLQLFLQVCAAVDYAHENLVVHRDLKPSNILVNEDGASKLLDFGVAKVLKPFEASPAASTRLFTLEYASPEQIRGETITIATDIYSLGAVLFELLAGHPPHALQNVSPLEAVRMISEQEAPRAPGVPKEVEAILRKTLHTEPARRYRSAHDLGADIERYLAGEAVLAVPDSAGYRMRKFARRNWIPVTAALAAALALMAGAGIALWQAHRAEQRFIEVRQLSNRFLFDFEGAIHNLAGATKARELVVKTAQEYLARLAGEARGDPELIREVAEAYGKLGNVQGSLVQGNSGDVKAALASYRKALDLRDALGDSRSAVPKVRLAYLGALSSLATAESRTGDSSQARRLVEKEVALFEQWTKDGSAGFEFLVAGAQAYSDLYARQIDKGEFAAAVVSARNALALREKALALDPGNRQRQRQAALGYWGVAAAEKEADNPAEAVANFSKAVELLRQVAEADPSNFSSRRELLVASSQLAASTKDLLRKQKKDLTQALPVFESTLGMGRQLLKEDPNNALVQQDVASISISAGSTFEQVGKPKEALSVLEPAMEIQEHRLVQSPGNREASYGLALLRMWSADCHKDLHDLAGALKDRRRAMELFDRLVAQSPSNYTYAHQKAHNLRETGDLLAALGDVSGARGYYHTGLEIAEKLPAGPASLDREGLLRELRDALKRAGQK